MHIRSTRDASALGIETVYQDLALADNLDIVQNMFLGRERLSYGLLDEDSMELQAAETLSALRVTTVRSIRQPVASLSGGQRQSVAVAKAVMWNSKLVLLDEPTAALGVVQTRSVLDLIKRLRDRGLAVMVISHNLTDVFEVADRIAVLYLGRMVAEGPTADLRPAERGAIHDDRYRQRAAVRGRRSPLVARAEADGQNQEAPVTADPGETPAGTAGAGTADLTLDAKVAAADVPPAILAQSLRQYLRASCSGSAAATAVCCRWSWPSWWSPSSSSSSPLSTPSCGRATSCTSSG